LRVPRPMAAQDIAGRPSAQGTVSEIGFKIAHVNAILAANRREAPLRATQDGEVAGHIDSTLLADDMRLDRFQNEPMLFRESSKIRL
jgi:hypothetical protein